VDGSLDCDTLALLLQLTAGWRSVEADRVNRWTASGGNIGSVVAHVAVRDVPGLEPGIYGYVGSAHELAQRLNSGGAKAHAIELDVRSYPSFEQAVGEAVKQSGRIDYLFNNAGIGVGGEIDSYTLDDWNDVFDVNLRGVVHGIQAVYPIMIQQHSGHIVNTASMAGLVAAAGAANYTASKHAVVALSKALRLEAERHGVQVSVLCPGAIRTPILAGGKYGRYDGVSDEQLLKFWEAFRPMAPEKFAERALRAVLRGDAIIVVPA